MVIGPFAKYVSHPKLVKAVQFDRFPALEVQSMLGLLPARVRLSQLSDGGATRFIRGVHAGGAHRRIRFDDFRRGAGMLLGIGDHWLLLARIQSDSLDVVGVGLAKRQAASR